MSAFDKPMRIDPVTNGGFVVSLDVAPDMYSPRMAFTNAADLLAWVTSELAPPAGRVDDVEAVLRDLKAEIATGKFTAAAHAAEKATKPSDPSTAPTVAPYEGCWAELRRGAVVGPLRKIKGKFWEFVFEGEKWTAEGSYSGDISVPCVSDIIAVHPSDPRITPETPSDDGWIEWKGGECPVDRETFIDFALRDGLIARGAAAGGWRWGHIGNCDDIVRYRLSRPSK